MAALPSKCRFHWIEPALQRLLSLSVERMNQCRVEAYLEAAATMFLPCCTSRSKAISLICLPCLAASAMESGALTNCLCESKREEISSCLV